MHLTNYSVNKKSRHFSENDDAAACAGHKWSLAALLGYLREHDGVDPAAVWADIDAVVVKTLLSAEGGLNSAVKCHAKPPGVACGGPGGCRAGGNDRRAPAQARAVWL